MSVVITSPISELQQRARNMLAAATDVPDVMSGLAREVLSSSPVDSVALPSNPELPDIAMLRRSPILSACGYDLFRYTDEDQAQWELGVERLRGREAFPGDGQSYIHNPTEVLGICIGIANLSEDLRNHREWFLGLIRRGLKEDRFRTPIARLGASIGLTILDPNASKDVAGQSDLAELRASPEWLMATAFLVAFCPATTEVIDVFETELVERLVNGTVTLTNLAEAAAALVIARRVSDRLALAGGQASAVEFVIALCRRFPLFAKQITKRQRGRAPVDINDEYDVQDLFHAILLLHFDDVRAEDVSPDYAGNTARVDFFLPKERLVIEAKMMRPSLTQKKVANELIQDIARYSQKIGADTLVCLVYDPDGICNTPHALETDLSKSSTRLNVHVVVCPQGK